jgi:tetratricopeptide (TPR) repeat protein
MLRVCSVLILLCALTTSLSAQTQAQPQATPQLRSTDGPETGQRITMARHLMRQNNYEAAAATLELVYETEPDHPVVFNLLKACYLQLKQYGKAETIIRRSLDTQPQNLTLRIELAEMLSNQGKKDDAKAAFTDATRLITDKDPNKYLLLLHSYIAHGFEDEALDLVASVRRDLGDSLLFTLEKGQVLERRKKYKDAVREYLPLLFQDTTYQAMEAERRFVLMLDFPESSPDVEKALRTLADDQDSKQAIRLLADFYIKSNRFDQAFEFAIKRDSTEGTQGSSLQYLMRQCYDRRLFAEAARLGEYVTTRYPKGPGFISAAMLYARSLAQLGRTTEARQIYDTVVAITPRDPDRAEALYALGEMYFEVVGDYQTALNYFDSVTTYYRHGMGYVNAMRNTPFCYLRLGDATAARQAFSFLRDHPVTDDVTEETQYYLGLLDFFENKYDSANVALRRLMIEHPTGFYVNDALQLVMVITEAENSPELLDDYARALWYVERRQPDSSRVWLDRIAQAGDKALADVALYKLTIINLQMNDSTAALESINRLDSDFTDSYYRPYGLKLKADMLTADRETVDQARAIYKQLLEQFPNYPFASEVRKKLRQLETDFKVG